MSADIAWSGLDALSREMAALPATVRARFKPAMVGAGRRIVDRTQARYSAEGVGDLGRGMRVDEGDDASEISVRVWVSHPLAHLRELGTVNRYTSRGHFRGRMPARPVFIPIVIEEREQVPQELERGLRSLPLSALSSR